MNDKKDSGVYVMHAVCYNERYNFGDSGML